MQRAVSVSYTHLDVYKRQILTQLALYSINLKIMGKANQSINVDKYGLLISLRWVKEFEMCIRDSFSNRTGSGWNGISVRGRARK